MPTNSTAASAITRSTPGRMVLRLASDSMTSSTMSTYGDASARRQSMLDPPQQCQVLADGPLDLALRLTLGLALSGFPAWPWPWPWR